MLRTRSFRFKLWALMLVASAVLSLAGPLLAFATEEARPQAGAGPAVYLIKVEQTVESGLYSYLERAYKEAEEAAAELVLLKINTLGGRVDSAGNIGELIRNAPMPTAAFIQGKALSAGTYIALHANQIIMQPESVMGAAAMVDGSGELIDNPKHVSAWVSLISSAAKLHGRDPQVAIAMADPASIIELPALGRTVGAGEILTIDADEAVLVGYADHIANTPQEALEWLGYGSRTVVEVDLTPAERFARFLTDPTIALILLIMGIAGVAIELVVPGFGVPGILGIVGFGLYFFGHYVAGFAGMESVLLFIAGLVLLVIELFVPSFGILGILGIASLVSGVVMAAYDTGSAMSSLLVAGLVSLVIVTIVGFIFKRRGVWNKFILSERLTTEEGFVPAASLERFAGLEGIAVTTLRPSGTIKVGDERIDAVADGQFINNGKKVKVVKVEGTRVVVRELE